MQTSDPVREVREGIEQAKRLARKAEGPPKGRIVGRTTAQEADAKQVEAQNDPRYWAQCSSCGGRKGSMALVARDPEPRWLCIEDCIEAAVASVESEDETRISRPENRRP